jgi:hypothetical protein
MTTRERYNGWANYPTWNVALWLGNDEGLYRQARAFASQHRGHLTARLAREFVGEVMPEGTPDTRDMGRVRYGEIARMLRELVEGELV